MAKVSIYESPYTGAIPKAKKKPVITGTSTAVKTTGSVSEPVTAQTVAQPSVVTEQPVSTVATPSVRQVNTGISRPVSTTAIRPPTNIKPTSTITVQNNAAATGAGGGFAAAHPQGGGQFESGVVHAAHDLYA
jgi:hypothetical protein